LGGPGADHRVTLFPTCLVEYRRPEVGRALVEVYSHSGIACDIASTGCCGAPWLTAGDTKRFAALAARNVAMLASAIRAGTDIVVAQPTCHAVITTDYADYVDRVAGADVELVAARTFDAVEYLSDHSSADHSSDVVDAMLGARFIDGAPTRIVHHENRDRLDDESPSAARRLLERTGATVTEVRRCTGVDGRWGLRVVNERIGIAVARELGTEIQRSRADVITGSCVLTNISIEEQTGRTVIHPLELIASSLNMDETDRDCASHDGFRPKFLWRRRFGRF
jgi:glycerol-3-phosphate dehydrogenase subunit C